MANASPSSLMTPSPLQVLRVTRTGPSNQFTGWSLRDVQQSIPAWFEKTVRMYPQRLALQAGNDVFTYEALNRAANQAARAILAHSNAGNQNIALLMEHGASLIIGILGALKAGKACVCLDASLLPARAAGTLADCRASLLLTDTCNLALAKELSAGRVPVLNLESIDDDSAAGPELAVSPDALAFIVYTSGSTGEPKGVMHNHRTFLFLIMHCMNWLHICPDDRHALISRASHIVGLASTFRCLLGGAALLPYDTHKDGLTALPAWVAQQQISIIHMPTSLYRRMVANAAREDLASVRVMQLTSEPIHKDDVVTFAEYFAPGCLLGTHYGSTDAGIITWCWIDSHEQTRATIVPVGYAPEDIDVMLLDDDQPVGPGVIGEIAVSHDYLPLGYWGRQELTSRRYLTDAAGRRTHLSGDMGELLADGLLILRGRKDAQVKVHGLRVDAAEVENALLSLGAIREAAVIARTDAQGEARLLAYIVPSARPAPNVSSLRRALATTLPDYAIPAAFVYMEALPLTMTGKVDRRALPDPGMQRPELAVAYVAPRTPLEEILAGIWAEVVGIERVGIHDNFFDLGGDSLRAAQVVARANEAFGVSVPLPRLFDSPTVAAMTLLITQAQAAQSAPAEIESLLADAEAMADDEPDGKRRPTSMNNE